MLNKFKEFISIVPNLDSSIGSLLTLLLGLSASVLTLVGLVSIFVSINSQQKIQKCREILWGINTDQLDATQIGNHLNLYYEIQTDGERFTKKTIKTAVFSIRAVCFILVLCMFSLTHTFENYEFFVSLICTFTAIIILILFSVIISRLSSIKTISDLPNIDDLLDTNNKNSEIATLLIAARSSKVLITRQIDGCRIILILPLPFVNMSIEMIARGNYGGRNEAAIMPDKNLISSPFSNSYMYDLGEIVDTNHSFKDANTINISIRLIFKSEQGHIHVSYYSKEYGTVIEDNTEYTSIPLGHPLFSEQKNALINQLAKEGVVFYPKITSDRTIAPVGSKGLSIFQFINNRKKN